jgi:hypothetical protein
MGCCPCISCCPACRRWAPCRWVGSLTLALESSRTARLARCQRDERSAAVRRHGHMPIRSCAARPPNGQVDHPLLLAPLGIQPLGTLGGHRERSHGATRDRWVDGIRGPSITRATAERVVLCGWALRCVHAGRAHRICTHGESARVSSLALWALPPAGKAPSVRLHRPRRQRQQAACDALAMRVWVAPRCVLRAAARGRNLHATGGAELKRVDDGGRMCVDSCEGRRMPIHTPRRTQLASVACGSSSRAPYVRPAWPCALPPPTTRTPAHSRTVSRRLGCATPTAVAPAGALTADRSRRGRLACTWRECERGCAFTRMCTSMPVQWCVRLQPLGSCAFEWQLARGRGLRTMAPWRARTPAHGVRLDRAAPCELPDALGC